MGLSRKKKRVDDKAWADWLSDETPEPIAPAQTPPLQQTSARPNGYQNLVRQQPQRPQQGIGQQQPGRQPIFRQQPQPQAQTQQMAPPQPVSVADKPLPWQQSVPSVTARNQPAQPPKTALEPPAPVVAISIQIPAFNKDQLRRATKRFVGLLRRLLARAKTNKRQSIAASIVVGLVVLGLFVPPLIKFGQHERQKSAVHLQALKNAKALGYAKPSFEVVVPSTKPQLATPDGKTSAYDAAKQSYSYIDNIAGKQFTVSQQQIPSGQKVPTVVQAAAKSVNATAPLTTGWGTAYMLTNQKYNSQTIVFSLKGILVFIQSSFILTNDQWTSYINSLQ